MNSVEYKIADASRFCPSVVTRVLNWSSKFINHFDYTCILNRTRLKVDTRIY